MARNTRHEALDRYLVHTADTLEWSNIGPVVRFRRLTINGPSRWKTYRVTTNPRAVIRGIKARHDIAAAWSDYMRTNR